MDPNQPSQTKQSTSAFPTSTPAQPQLENRNKNKNLDFSHLKKSKPFLFGLAGVFVLILLIIALLIASQGDTEMPTPIKNSDPEKELTKAQEEKNEATLSAEEAAKPINRLQKAYDDVIGSNSLKRTLTLDESGVATIDYVIASGDGTLILTTSYTQFADLAVKVFNIETVKKLSVSSYATKFTDQFGQPNQVAVKLEVNRETHEKINWPVKKHVYKDYSTILNTHQVNSALDKEYKALVREK